MTRRAAENVPSAPAQGHEPDLSRVPTRELVSRGARQAARILRDEAELTRIDLRRSARTFGAGGALLGVAGGLAFFGAACLVTALVLVFTTTVAPWVAAVDVGVVLLVGAGAAGGLGLLAVRRAARRAGARASEVRTDLDAVRSD